MPGDWSAIIAEATATVGLAGLIVKVGKDLRDSRKESKVVRDQLTPNGGGSLADAIARIELKVENVDHHVKDVHEEAHRVHTDHAERIRDLEREARRPPLMR